MGLAQAGIEGWQHTGADKVHLRALFIPNQFLTRVFIRAPPYRQEAVLPVAAPIEVLQGRPGHTRAVEKAAGRRLARSVCSRKSWAWCVREGVMVCEGGGHGV